MNDICGYLPVKLRDIYLQIAVGTFGSIASIVSVCEANGSPTHSWWLGVAGGVTFISLVDGCFKLAIYWLRSIAK